MKKNFKVIGYGLWVMVALLVSAPLTAQSNQQDQWKTSSLQGSGSAYSSNVTAVGATTVMTNTGTVADPYGGTTTPSGPRRAFDNPGEFGQGESPIGDAMLPLLALACVYGIYCAMRVYRRKRSV